MNWEIMWIMFLKWVTWSTGLLFLAVTDCNNWNNSFSSGNFDNVSYESCLNEEISLREVISVRRKHLIKEGNKVLGALHEYANIG